MITIVKNTYLCRLDTERQSQPLNVGTPRHDFLELGDHMLVVVGILNVIVPHRAPAVEAKVQSVQPLADCLEERHCLRPLA